MTKKLAEDQAKANKEVLRSYTLRGRESDYLKRMVTQLNAELSPFKDVGKENSVFLREMLDSYRAIEDFERSTTKKNIERNDIQVHKFLKAMESGPDHPDTETLQKLQEGIIEKDN